MRKLVEKFYRDRWVLSLELGLAVNLLQEWDNCKAASSALTSTIDVAKARGLAEEHTRGLLDTDIPHQEKADVTRLPLLVAFAKEFNTHLRWLVLHSSELPFLEESLR